jgi:hypothetical protein
MNHLGPILLSGTGSHFQKNYDTNSLGQQEDNSQYEEQERNNEPGLQKEFI